MSESFRDIMTRLEQGEDRAATEVFYHFADRLIRLSRKRLSDRLRQKLDAEDVMQSVFRTFFRRHAEGQFALESWDALWAVLVVIAVRKCGRHAASFRAGRRNVQLEVAPQATADDSRPAWEVPGREPSPEEVVALTETVQRIMERLDERQRQLVALRLQGYTIAEVAEQVGCTERTVYRVLGEVRQRVTELGESLLE